MPGINSKIVLGVVAVTLASCGPRPTPGIKVEYVDRPVVQMKTCIKPGDIPSQPTALGKVAPPDNLETALALALAKVSEWTRYGHKASVILDGCSK